MNTMTSPRSALRNSKNLVLVPGIRKPYTNLLTKMWSPISKGGNHRCRRNFERLDHKRAQDERDDNRDHNRFQVFTPGRLSVVSQVLIAGAIKTPHFVAKGHGGRGIPVPQQVFHSRQPIGQLLNFRRVAAVALLFATPRQSDFGAADKLRRFLPKPSCPDGAGLWSAAPLAVPLSYSPYP